MTDQIPADKVREIAEKMRDHAADRYVADVERRNIMVFAKQLEALLSTPPTQWSLYWRTGDRQIVEGPDVATAMNCAGIGAGALAALDFYEKGAENHGYRWSADDRRWVKEEA